MALADLKPGEHAVSVRNHWWWRPGWRVGRRFYAFHVTFESQPSLYNLAATYRTALAGMRTVTLVPDQWLHLTMQGLDFADRIQPSALDRVAAEAGTILDQLSPITVQFQEVVVADEAIAMPASPPGPLQQLRGAVREAIGRVFGHDQIPEDPRRFRPHVSVAYLTAEGAADPYVAAVSGVHPEPAAVSIDHVSLIEMHRDNRMYEWDTLVAFPLRGTTT
jgi:2'-5' RNA ligase